VKSLGDLKVAIVHDWLIGGGAERVVLELHHLFPEAPIYTSYCTPEWRQKLDGKVITGWLQHWPLSALRKFVPPLRISYFTRLKLNGYDLVISSSGAEAKGIKVPEGTVHVNYCHAPTHYYWSRYDEYLAHPGFGPFNWLARLGLKLLVSPLRKWDHKAAQRPHYILANSTHIQAEIRKYYGRDSVVVHPPIDTDRFMNIQSSAERTGFVVAGRQTPYKRIDLAVAACTALNLPLTVIGRGPDHAKLVKMAGPTITFVTNASDEAVAQYFANALAFIFPGLDDFGITPVEAMAAGTPVIAYKAGGALDYVIPGRTGEFFTEQTVESLNTALQQFNPKKYHSHDIKTNALQFNIENFRNNVQTELEHVLQ
jgi:glycosyltransferase involved in cell wall biosynthesis